MARRSHVEANGREKSQHASGPPIYCVTSGLANYFRGRTPVNQTGGNVRGSVPPRCTQISTEEIFRIYLCFSCGPASYLGCILLAENFAGSRSSLVPPATNSHVWLSANDAQREEVKFSLQ